jgi:hypothetical protein
MEKRKFDITFVAGTPLYVSSFEATEFQLESGFFVFYNNKDRIAAYPANLVIGISGKFQA